jgi:hypothetical protein
MNKEKQFIKEHIQDFIEWRDKHYFQAYSKEFISRMDDFKVYTEIELINEYLKIIPE